jgi:hypothetical protein
LLLAAHSPSVQAAQRRIGVIRRAAIAAVESMI